MEAHVFAMVLIAALLHAGWNALVKAGEDRLIVMAVVTAGSGVASFAALPFVSFPAPDVWPYIGLSLLLHNGYYLLLLGAYRHGELSHVYPIARGSAPLLVALVSVTVVGETLTRHGLLGVVMIALGILSVALTKGTSGLRELRPVVLALGTGCFIAAYTVVDGMGARLAGDPHGYTFWLFALDTFPLAIVAVSVHRRDTLRQVGRTWKTGLLGGLVSLIAAWIVIWALTLAPMALVSALRETSMVFAVVIGVVILKERLNLVRLAAMTTALIGTVMLKMSK